MLRRNLWVLNIFFLLGFSYFIADLVNLFIGQKLETVRGGGALEEVSIPPPQIQPSRETYSSIVERNIFGINPAGAIVVEKSVEVTAPVTLPPLLIRLIGTVVGEGEEPLAVIETLGINQQGLFRLQDDVQGGAILVSIKRNEIVIQRGNIRESFFVEEGPSVIETKSGPGTVRLPVSPQVKPPGNKWTLDKREVDAALENLPALLTKARVVPNLASDGKNNGFRIVSIAPSSFYEKIGLQNGDVIQQINGIDIRDPATFMQVFTQLRQEPSISLDLLRNNQKESFSYEIR